MAEKRYYELIDKDGNKHTFTGRSPRQAALKAASRGNKTIKLRERGRKNLDGTKSLHIFEGSVKTVPKPDKAPAWIKGDTIKKPSVKKIGVEHI